VGLPFREWAYHSDITVDLAAVPLVFPKHTFDIWYYTLNDETVIVGKREHEVVAGDAINLVGLFRLHSGSQRNVPFVHTENIAVLPDANERRQTHLALPN
jgi:hypothetical protein